MTQPSERGMRDTKASSNRMLRTGTLRHNFVVGDHVLLKQKKRNKWSSAYEPAFYTIIQTNRSSIAACRITVMHEKCIEIQAMQFKIVNALIQDNTREKRDDREEKPTAEVWRERILLNVNPQSVQEESYHLYRDSNGRNPQQ